MDTTRLHKICNLVTTRSFFVTTVNVVIFAGGKLCENVGKTFLARGNFHVTSPIFIQSFRF